MNPAAGRPREMRCGAAREWLARRPLRDDPAMVGARSTLTWDEWLRRGRAADVEVCLIEFLAEEPDPVTRAAIAMALGHLGGARSVGPLLGLLTDREDLVAMEAAAALGLVGDRSAVTALVAALTRDDPNVRANVCQALAVLGGEQADRALADALADRDPFVRSVARQALARHP
ncbi:hypothetical protein CKO41_10295 [Thiococcus pfennigii]|nr:hypothetical protein [Thiococcus pfennigii]